MINIEIWSDFVCPFCYIGKRELDNAIEKTGLKEHVNIKYNAFELSPNGPTKPTLSVLDELSKKYGRSKEEVQQMTGQTVERAKTLGLEYNYDNLMSQDTLKAHRVAKLAEEEGKDKEFQERAFYGVFTENVFLPDTDQLVQLATDIGLDETKVREVAEDSNAYLEEVQTEKKQAGAIGINSVPFFVFNEKYAVQGAQMQETFEQVLEKIAEEENITVKPKLQTFGSTDEACGPDGCEI